MFVRVLFLMTASVVLGTATGCTSMQLGIPETSITWDGADGSKAWKLEPDAVRGPVAEVELEDCDGVTVCEYEYDALTIQFEYEDREYWIVPIGNPPGLFELGGPQGMTHRFLREPDGDLRFEESGGVVLYKLKARDYGVKVVDAAGREQKVRRRDGKTSISADGETWLSTRDVLSPAAAGAFAMQDFPIEIRAGIALALMRWPEGTAF